MIRKFNKAEVLETFIETIQERTPISLVEQSIRVELSAPLHVIVERTIEKLIKKASPNLNFSIEINPIHTKTCPYRGVKSFEPHFGADPSDVHFYVSRQAVPQFFCTNTKGEQTLTSTHISIDYYYPATWAMTPPRDKEVAVRRTMDEILFAWTIVLKTLTCAPIIRFDDEEEAAEAVFAFANALLFREVVADRPYYNSDFLKRLMYIQKAIRGGQPVHNSELATILYPPNRKIGQLEVPVARIEHNKLTQYVEGYLSCHCQDRYDEYLGVLTAFDFSELEKEDAKRYIIGYLSDCVGKAPDDYRTYNVPNIRKLITNDGYRTTRPPMINANFKGVSFNEICPFTYGSRGSTYIYFEKDIVSHLEKTFKHLGVEEAIGLARDVRLPKNDEVNDGYDVDPSLIELDLFNFWAIEGTTDVVKRKTTYKNKGLYIEENPPQEAPGDFMFYWEN